jgi:hypothetical protein
MGWTGSSVVIAATDGHGNLNCWWQPHTTPWHYKLAAAA